MILAFPIIVNATNEEVNDICIESDMCIKEEIIKYNTYSLNYIDMGYLDLNDDFIRDTEDYILDESDEIIKIHTTNKKISKLTFLYLPTDLKISELEIYNKDELVKYTPRLNYYVQFSDNLYDSDVDTYYVHGHPSVFFILYLDDEYDIKDLTIKIYTKKQDNNYINLEVGDDVLLDNSIDRWHIINFIIDNTNTTNYEIKSNKKYRYYKEERVINNVYLTEGDNLILDDFIIEYVYHMKGLNNLENNEVDYLTDIYNEGIEELSNTIINENIYNEKVTDLFINLEETNNNNPNNIANLSNSKDYDYYTYNLEDEYEDYDEIIYVKEDNKVNKSIFKIIKYIITIFFICIEIILFIKRKKNNVESI